MCSLIESPAKASLRRSPLLTCHPLTGAVRPVTAALLAETYLADRVDWAPAEAVLALPAAPWAESAKIAPEATSEAVEAALVRLMRSTSDLSVNGIGIEDLPEGRARAHLDALVRLWRALGDMLPPSLAPVRAALAATSAGAWLWYFAVHGGRLR